MKENINYKILDWDSQFFGFKVARILVALLLLFLELLVFIWAKHLTKQKKGLCI